MSRLFLWFVLLSVIIAPSVKAQKLWSLQDCIDYAVFHNLDLKMQELNINIQEKNLLQSKMNLLPSVSANGSDVNNWGKTVDRYTNEFADTRVSSINLYLQSSVTLFRGFQLLNSIKSENLELTARKYDFFATRDMKAMEITTAYLQILYGKENLKSKSRQVKLTKMQLDRTEKLVNAGTLAEGDLFNMKAQLASDESQRIQADNDLTLAYLSMKQLLDLPADTAFEIVTPEIELTGGLNKLLNPGVVYDYAVQNRPEVLSAQTRYDRSLKDLAVSRGAYYPSLTFSAGFGTGYSGANLMLDGDPRFTGWKYSGEFTTGGDTVLTPQFEYKTIPKPFADQVDENKNYSIGFYLTVPIFNGLQARNRVGMSKIAVEQARLQLEKSKRDIRKTIEQAYADARSAYKSYQAAKLNVEALQQAYNYAEKKFNAGMINSYEFNDAKIKLENARNNLLNAKYNYVFRVKVLDFYFGQPLTF